MHEGDLQPEDAASRRGVDQLGALHGERPKRGAHVVDLVRDVVHPRAALREKTPDGRVVAEGRKQLDASVTDAHRCRLDALLLDALPMLEPAAEQPFVRRDRGVEIVDCHSHVVNASCLHGRDGTVAHMVRRLAIALVAVAGLAGGCGGGGEKGNGEADTAPDQVVADARDAATSATSVHVAGAIVAGNRPLALDLELVKGRGGKGSMSEANLRFEVVRVGHKVYIKGSDAFLRSFAGRTGATLLHGKWLEGSTTSQNLAGLEPLTDIAKLFNGALGSHGKLRNDGETQYRGQKVVAIKDLTHGATLYVAATGPPYPVALVGGNERGEIRFDKWNDSATIEAPKGAVDLSSIGR